MAFNQESKHVHKARRGPNSKGDINGIPNKPCKVAIKEKMLYRLNRATKTIIEDSYMYNVLSHGISSR
jgi:hypothetical protein